MPGAGGHPGPGEGQPPGTPPTARAEEGTVANPVQGETTKTATACGGSAKTRRSDVLLKATATTCVSSDNPLRSDVELLAVPAQLLTAAGVESATASQVAAWATTKPLVQALLAAACQRTEVRPPQATQGEGVRASCTEARLVACALLSRVFSGPDEDDGIGQGRGILAKGETPLLLDRWYEDFCGAAACFGGGRSSCLEETPRLLLEGMLSVPAVRTGFVQRGLVPRLAEGLRLSWGRRRGCLSSSPPEGDFCCSAKPSQRADVEDCLDEDGPRNDADQDKAVANGLRARTQHSARTLSPRAGFRDIPWESQPTAGGAHGGEAGNSASVGGARVSAELDESSKTSSEKGFTSGEEEEEEEEDENISPTTQNYDPTDDGRGDGDNNLAFTASAPPSPTGERGPGRGRGGRGWGAEGGEGAGGGSSRERIAPPRLRLDALDSVLSGKEWASPRSCSPHAAVTLSAASTRASTHLVSF